MAIDNLRDYKFGGKYIVGNPHDYKFSDQYIDRNNNFEDIWNNPGNYSYEEFEKSFDSTYAPRIFINSDDGDENEYRTQQDLPNFQSRKNAAVNDWLGRRQGAAAQAAAANNNSNPTPLDIDPKRGTGEYDDIIDSLRDELGTAQQTIADIRDRQVSTPQTPSVQDQLAEVLAQMQLDFQQRYSGLQDMMLQQQQSFQSSMSMFQQQAQAAQAAYQQQLQLSQNMAKAYVPPAEQSAATAAIGDQREMETRRSEDNVLSELSILSGLGTSSNPLSGLQLA